jgi:hypothetical protein
MKRTLGMLVLTAFLVSTYVTLTHGLATGFLALIPAMGLGWIYDKIDQGSDDAS